MKAIRLNPGDKYNRLTIIKLNHIRQKQFTKNNKQYVKNLEYYLCKCDCGNECIVEKAELKRGRTKSCGCFQTETRKKIFKNNKFGKKYNICDNSIKNIRLYNIWIDIKKRCYNKNETHCISEWAELLKMNKNSNCKQVINKLNKVYAKR